MGASRNGRKTTSKTTSDPGWQPGANGGRLRAGGTRGNRGGPGRPSNAFKEYCARLLEDRACQAQVRRVLRDASHPAFAALWKAIAERAYGKAPQAVEVSGPGGGAVPVQVIEWGGQRIAF